MASWILVPCLVSLRSEINTVAPSRDKTTDGAIGDIAHQKAGTSDHLPDEQTSGLRGKDADSVNEVHAIDVDRDLRQSGWSMDRIVQIIVTRCRSGAESRLAYIIWNRKIWSRSWGWQARAYTGPNPHDHHAHFSARYETSLENSTRPWGLLDQQEEDVALTTDDKTWLSAEISKQVTALIDDIWRYDVGAASGRDKQAAYSALVTANVRAGSVANDQLPKLAVVLGQLAGQRYDQAALVGALVPALTDAIVARLPADTDDVTTAELKDAVVAAARDLLS